MTGFEEYLKSEGSKLIDGNIGEFSTYTNIQRTWLYGRLNIPIQIGLVRINDQNVIMIRYPILTYLPDSNFEKFIDNYIIKIHLDKKLEEDKVQLII